MATRLPDASWNCGAPIPDCVPAEGAYILDDTGDRKDGCATDHVARKYHGSVGKSDNGIVIVTTLWARAALLPAPYGALHAGRPIGRRQSRPDISRQGAIGAGTHYPTQPAFKNMAFI